MERERGGERQNKSERNKEKERQRQVRSDSRVLMSVMIGGHDGICLLCGTAENHVFGLSA